MNSHYNKVSLPHPAVQDLDLEDLFMYKENAFTGFQAYKNSKAANLMFTYELSRQLDGTNVKVNAVCPGNATLTRSLDFSYLLQEAQCVFY